MTDFDAKVAELHARKLSQVKIAAELGCGLQTVRRAMKRQGLQGQSTGVRAKPLNDHVFDTIDTAEKAYWLGFLLADGCIAKSAGTRRTIRLSLQRRDEQHLLRFGKFVGFSGTPYRTTRDGHPRTALVFNSVPMTTTLIKKGWLSFKEQGKLGIFGHIPDALLNHCIRGYFDGDGCVSRRRKRKSSWYARIVCPHAAPLRLFNEIIADATGVARDIKPGKTVYRLSWNGRQQAQRVLDWLYRDADLRLERKYLRYRELSNASWLSWMSMHDFESAYTPADVKQMVGADVLINDLTDRIVSAGWTRPQYDVKADLERCGQIDLDTYYTDGKIYQGQSPGLKTILTFQPLIWHVSLGGKPALGSLEHHRLMVKRAVTALLTTGSRIYPERLVRELLFAGFTRASVLSVPVLMAAVKHFKLKGTWFDPCAGWGNRLLAAHLLGLPYAGVDPGPSFGGLVRLTRRLNSSASLQHKPWQSADWPKNAFVLTSTPFHDKEDYLDGAKYGSFAEWYAAFLRPLVECCLKHCRRTVLHVDKAMKQRLQDDFRLDAIDVISRSRHKAPLEYFVEVTRYG